MHNMVNGIEVPLTEAEITEMAERMVIYEQGLIDQAKVKYATDRADEYPSTDSLIVAMWESLIEGDNTAMDDIQAKRLLIKSKYPKPTETV